MGEHIKAFDLQLFADGAGDGGAAGAGDAAGVTGQGDAAPVYDMARKRRGLNPARYDAPAAQAQQQEPTATADGAQAPQVPQADERQEPQRQTFEQLIEGEYKAEFDKRVQQIVKGRLKSAKGAEEQLGRIAPALQAVASRYGLDASDISAFDADALVKAIDEDKSLYEDEAYREGIPVETLMKQKQLEREVQQARAIREQQQSEAQMREQYERLQEQADEFRAKVPEFDLGREMQNDTFARMVVSGFPVENAYYATHYAEIEAMRAKQSQEQMRAVAQNAQQAAANAIRANQRRPSEIGTGQGTPAQVRLDPSQLKLADFRAIRERARRGEEIQF